MHIRIELNGTAVGVPHTITKVSVDGHDLVVSESDVYVSGDQVQVEFEGDIPVNKERENAKATWVILGIILMGVDIFYNSNLFLRGILLITFVLMCGDLLKSIPTWISWGARFFFVMVALTLLAGYSPQLWELIQNIPELIGDFFK